MATDPQKPGETPRSPFPTSPPDGGDKPAKPGAATLAPADDDKPPEELTEEELRLMADTMPGDGPGDD